MTTWADCAPTVAKAAPLLGWLLGPLDTIAGGAVGAIVSSVVGTPADDPEAVAAAIAADPTLLGKLREAELANQAILASYALQQRQAEWAAQTANDAQWAPQFSLMRVPVRLRGTCQAGSRETGCDCFGVA
jgi:hypothetical protein